jgi:SAM-dependent methyltransferase
MEPSEYDNIARLEDRHWWYRGMAAISLSFLKRALSSHPKLRAKLRVLDAGCGSGGMLRRLASLGQPFGIDLHPTAIAYAHRSTNDPLARASVEHLPFADDSFDLVTSFDVLYHLAVEDDVAALREFGRVLKSDGLLLLRLPAFERLRGAHDVTVHTRHRYTAPELRSKLNSAGFHVQRLTYANTLLLPLIALRRSRQSNQSEHTDVELPSPFVNHLLEFVLGLERRWLAHFDFPFGVSVFALAHRR